MTNIELAATLEALAVKYRKNEDLPQITLSKWTCDKEELAALLKRLGGRWKKAEFGHDTLNFTSDSLPGLTVYIPRDKVCRKIVTYDCDPIMSPAEEAEVPA